MRSLGEATQYEYCRWVSRAAILASFVMVLVACSSSSPFSPQIAAPPAEEASQAGKYDQTWSTAYGETSCLDWTSGMDAHQRSVAAADMLLAARRSDGDEELPDDALIGLFEDSIDEVCRTDTEGIISIAEAAASLYTLSSDFQP